MGVGASAAIGFPARYTHGLGNDSYVVRQLEQQVLCDGVNTSVTSVALTGEENATRGPIYAVNQFLRTLGVRFIAPGEI